MFAGTTAFVCLNLASCRVGRFLSAISVLQHGLWPFLNAQSKCANCILLLSVVTNLR